MKEIFSQKLRQARVLNAMSLQDLADSIGVSIQMISNYENGTSMPSSKLLIQLAKSLKVKLDYFFTPSFVELGEANFYNNLNYDPQLERNVDAERILTSNISNRFEQLVYRAYSQELISASKASSLLNININEVLEKSRSKHG